MISDTEAIRLYRDGLSCQKIATIHHCSDTSIINILKRHNIQRRIRGCNIQFQNKIIQMHNDGYSVNKIIDKLSLSHTIVYYWLKQHGIVLKTNVQILSERYGNKNPLWSGYEGIRGSKWASIRDAAKKRKISFAITIQDAWSQWIKQNGICPYTGYKLILCANKNDAKESTASLDRINSDKGYSICNIQWTTKSINKMKNSLSNDNFIYLCGMIANNTHKASNEINIYDININYKYRMCKYRAQKKKIFFDLSQKDIKDVYFDQGMVCKLSGIPIKFKGEYLQNKDGAASIDRIDSNLGYTKTNIQIVHKDINYMKLTSTNIDFINICKDIDLYKRSKYVTI